MKIELSKTFRFESAHWLPSFPEGHKCRRLHGHSFRIAVQLKGEMDESKGYLMDYGDISAVVRPLVDMLDHRLINEVGDELSDPHSYLLQNPTSENLARWFYVKLKPVLPLLESITVFETCTTKCIYRGE